MWKRSRAHRDVVCVCVCTWDQGELGSMTVSSRWHQAPPVWCSGSLENSWPPLSLLIPLCWPWHITTRVDFLNLNMEHSKQMMHHMQKNTMLPTTILPTNTNKYRTEYTLKYKNIVNLKRQWYHIQVFACSFWGKYAGMEVGRYLYMHKGKKWHC